MSNPILRLVAEQKAQVGEEVIVWVRIEDFYEVFGEDAKVCARELDLTLTSREVLRGPLEQRVPMAGVPVYAIERYVRKLVEKGYRTVTLTPEEGEA
mgnify:CR=1 FL=1